MDSHLLSSLPVSGQETPSAASGQALPPNEAGSPASSAGMVVRRAWLLPVYFYKACISPLSQPCCRFYPTCSQYALEAVLKHGVLRGSALAARRLLRCRPGGGCGYDPVP